jgi:hypothetical protein
MLTEIDRMGGDITDNAKNDEEILKYKNPSYRNFDYPFEAVDTLETHSC